ncbi:MAG: hypothetical protein HY791_15645 [Deltaproteobacteria bacterium]|nr:hypothetical protein [Deltaproteobacteria bacterium]
MLAQSDTFVAREVIGFFGRFAEELRMLSRTRMLGAVVALIPACDGGSNTALTEVPAHVELLALVIEDESGLLVHATGLEERKADGTFRFEIPEGSSRGLSSSPSFDRSALTSGGSLKDGQRVTLIGFAAEELASLSPPENLSSWPISPRAPGDPKLPTPAWSGTGAWGEEIALREGSVGRAWTAKWISDCQSDPCEYQPIMETRRIELPGEYEDAILALSEGSSALVVCRPGALYRVFESGEVQRVESSTTTSIYGGAMAPDGTAYFVTVGKLMSWRPESGFRTVAPSSNIDNDPKVVVSPSPPFEVFIATQRGTVERFDGTKSEIVHETDRDIDSAFPSSIAWVPPSTAVAAFTKVDEIVRYRGGVVSIDREIIAPRSLAFSPELGLIVGRDARPPNNSALFRFDDESATYRLIEDGPTQGLKLARIWPVGFGLILGGISGQLGYYHPGLGVCNGRPFADETINSVVRVGTKLLIVGFRATSSDSETSVFLADISARATRPECAP